METVLNELLDIQLRALNEIRAVASDLSEWADAELFPEEAQEVFERTLAIKEIIDEFERNFKG